MAYYLADFIRMGACFVPMSKPKMLSKNRILLYGNLQYRDDNVKIAVETRKGSVTKIVRTIGLSDGTCAGEEEAMRHRDTLQRIHHEAMCSNTNGLRDCVFIRFFVSVLLVICLLILAACGSCSLVCFFMRKEFSFLAVCIGSIIFFRLFHSNRWRIIPYGYLEGAVYEKNNIQEK